MIVSRFEGDHRSVSLDQVILVDEAKIALSWMELVLFGSRRAHASLTSPSLCDGCKPGHYELKANTWTRFCATGSADLNRDNPGACVRAPI